MDQTGRRPVLVDGWDTYFYSDLHKLVCMPLFWALICNLILIFLQPYIWKEFGKNKQTLHDLWLGFLRYYTEAFDAKNFVIQMRRFEPMSKFEKLWSDKPLAIEDPFDLNHNLASGLSWRSKRIFKLHASQIRKGLGGSKYSFQSPLKSVVLSNHLYFYFSVHLHYENVLTSQGSVRSSAPRTNAAKNVRKCFNLRRDGGKQ